MQRLSIVLFFLFPLQVFAETAQKGPIQPESTIATESMTKMIIGLLLVLAIIVVVAWVLKRFSIIPTTTAGHLKTVAAVSVGQRERVVIVEIGETWLVLGVAPGQVNKLHSMEKLPPQINDQTPKNPTKQFSETLDQHIQNIKN